MADRIELEVLFFAIARERAGRGSQRLSLPAPATLQDAIDALVAQLPDLGPLLPYVRFAVDEVFERDLSRALRDGAVLAMIPPVAGGAPRVRLCHQALEPRAVEALVTGPDRGGVVTFSGVVRDHTGEHAVTRLEYEAYESMAVSVMEALVAEVEAEHPPARLACHHRLGTLGIGELAVVVAAAAPHRKTAFAACQRYIDRLKEDVPIFKREVRGDGSVWVGMGP